MHRVCPPATAAANRMADQAILNFFGPVRWQASCLITWDGFLCVYGTRINDQ
jgi:hypothetical protein